MKLPMAAPNLDDLWRELDVSRRLSALLEVEPLSDGEYYHWDQLRHRQPPSDLTAEEWWLGVKIARSKILKPLPFTDKKGANFQYGMPDPVLRLLHGIDQDASGRIQMAEEVTNPATRDRYIVNSLIEESIRSSQLEGASTTTDVAKNMIRSGRRPTDRSEQMIVNNYMAMRFVQQHAQQRLTPELVFALHRTVSDNTLDDPQKAGRFRSDSDNVIVEDGLRNVLHVPPAAKELPSRLKTLCAFANERSTATFMHPVVRAIILHFIMGYDHPFVDGNGRTARALFYWSMLSQGYWLTEYLSISRILRKAPGQYSRAFVYSETDDNDLTYFAIYQLQVIRRAIVDLQRYLRRKISELRQIESLLRSSDDLNHRQLALLTHALKHPGAKYTILSHQVSHNIVYDTARTDLLGLATRGFLQQRKSGRAYLFTAPTDLSGRLRGRSTATRSDTPAHGR